MIERFQGPDGQRRLLDALLQQHSIARNVDYAAAITGVCDLEEYQPGKDIIVQGAEDDAIFFILAGAVSILVNGREVNRRKHGQHVGEMSLIDSAARRSATVRAIEVTVAAKVSEVQFSEAAKSHPELWRIVAVDLAQRLRERGALVPPRNDVPHVFIGSSTEQLDIARAIQTGLDHDGFIVRVWTDGVFGASGFAVTDLEAELNKSDFAVLVAGPDDHVYIRGKEVDAPRDNVVFELGLFIGGLGHGRVYIVHPRGVDIKIPTDLLGLNPLTYVLGPPDTLNSRIGTVCTEIRNNVQKQGPK